MDCLENCKKGAISYTYKRRKAAAETEGCDASRRSFLSVATLFAAGTIALSLNAGGYLSEIFRGGIQAVDPGQREAARSLGLSARQTTWRIIIPQAIRICIPSVVNQWCITIKDTSIISVIGLAELTKMGQQIIARTYQSFQVWIIVGVMYFAVIWLLTLLARVIERKVSLG
jgi:ABC-type amino acid transport system permease subunit